MILFTSQRPLERAENLKAVYDAYDGEKCYKQLNPYKQIPDLHSGKYELQVTDELPSDTVGKCLFIGHAMGAGKTYGLDQPRAYFNRPDLITYAICSSEDIKPIVAKQCGISETQVVPLGLPRTDIYFKSTKTNTKNYLYAPTFRGGDWLPDWKILSANTNAKIIVKRHMLTPKLLQNDLPNVYEVDNKAPSADYIINTDVLITDFSSVMFDALVLKKPVVLFAKDKDGYLRNRGMYFDYPKRYSEYFCDNEYDLIDVLKSVKWNNRFELLRQFYSGACDGGSTKRTIDLIRSMI